MRFQGLFSTGKKHLSLTMYNLDDDLLFLFHIYLIVYFNKNFKFEQINNEAKKDEIA